MGYKWYSLPLLILLCKLFDSFRSRIPVNVEHWVHRLRACSTFRLSVSPSETKSVSCAKRAISRPTTVIITPRRYPERSTGDSIFSMVRAAQASPEADRSRDMLKLARPCRPSLASTRSCGGVLKRKTKQGTSISPGTQDSVSASSSGPGYGQWPGIRRPGTV